MASNAEIIRKVSSLMNCSRKQAKDFFESLFQVVNELLSDGEKIYLPISSTAITYKHGSGVMLSGGQSTKSTVTEGRTKSMGPSPERNGAKIIKRTRSMGPRGK